MRNTRVAGTKFAVFATAMLVLTGALFLIFGQYRTGTTNHYSATFTDASRLKAGQTVRFAGVRVGTVNKVDLRPDKTVEVSFDVDRALALTGGTHANIRYLNLVGDRFLELVDGAGPATLLPPGSHIPAGNTAPALDLDLLLGGLKPVIQGLNPQDVNALSASLIEILQGQGDTVESLLQRTSTFSNALADKSATIQALVDNLRTTLGTLAGEGAQFSDGIDRLQRLVSALAADREPIGTAIDSLDPGTASLTDLLGSARPALAGTIDQLNRLAPNLDAKKDRIDTALQKAPENFRKLIRIGSYGSFVNYYICSISVRVSDLQDRTAEFPAFRQEGGRCAEN